jgi:hypothetical protein
MSTHPIFLLFVSSFGSWFGTINQRPSILHPTPGQATAKDEWKAGTKLIRNMVQSRTLDKMEPRKVYSDQDSDTMEEPIGQQCNEKMKSAWQKEKGSWHSGNS